MWGLRQYDAGVDDRTFRRDFFRQLNDAALEPDDPRYVRIYDDERISADDPIALMQTTIEWTVGASVQLFSGFRGSGKSTELRRLRARLRDSGYLVLLFDAEDYLNLSIPVDVPDFLLAMAGALGEAVVDSGLLADDPAKISYWDRFQSFLHRIHLSAEIEAGRPRSVSRPTCAGIPSSPPSCSSAWRATSAASLPISASM